VATNIAVEKEPISPVLQQPVIINQDHPTRLGYIYIYIVCVCVFISLFLTSLPQLPDTSMYDEKAEKWAKEVCTVPLCVSLYHYFKHV